MLMKKLGYQAGKFARGFFLLFKVAICLYPIYWMITLSFKTEQEAAYNVYSFPKHVLEVGFSNYKLVLEHLNYGSGMKNSLIYSVFITFFTTLFAITAAYALTRMRFKYADIIYKYFLIGLAVPGMCLIVPVFMILKFMGLTGTRWAILILGCAAAAPGAILMVAYMRSVPYELEEAAAIDGCNIHRAFVSIMLPIFKPALATRAMLDFLRMWNEYGYSSILCMNQKIRPMVMETRTFFNDLYATNWANVGAAIVLSAGPAILVYSLANRSIENALTAGAILK